MIDSAEFAEPPPRTWLTHLAVAGVSGLAGVAVTVVALLLAGWRYVPVHRYEVTVVLEAETTVGQRDTVSRALTNAVPGTDVHVVTREELFEGFRKEWEAQNGELPESVTAAGVPERLEISTRGRDFDCAVLADVKASTEVSALHVRRVHGGTGQLSGIRCR